MTTVRDVAREAGVSPSTVSRVLNDSRSISPATKERVRGAIKRLGFVANVLARNFANQSTHTVGLVINIENSRAYSNPFFSEVLHGIETALYPEGYFLIIANERTISRQQITLDQLVGEKRIDGLILPSSTGPTELLRKLNRAHFPFVVIGEPDTPGDEADFVDVNNSLGSEQAVRHLVQHGYRRIAYLGGRSAERFNQRRLEGFRSALAQRNLPIDEGLIVEETGEITRDSGWRLTGALLSLPAPPDAMVCTDNILAWGAIKAARERSVAVPKDLGIVSFDNFPLAEFVEPALTTVDIDVFALGVQAAGMLIRRLRMGELPHQQSLIATRLIVRQSSVREGEQ